MSKGYLKIQSSITCRSDLFVDVFGHVIDEVSEQTTEEPCKKGSCHV